MLRITQVKLQPGEPVSLLPQKIGKLLRIKDFQPDSWKIVRESVDARKKPQILFIYTVDFSVKNEKAILERAKKIKGVQLQPAPDTAYKTPADGRAAGTSRPVIVGSGPCGLFATLILAEAGARPLLLERGRSVEQRTVDVEHFWATGELDPVSNVQFGEGGAGTFSDGKLTTGIKDPRIGKVNEVFIEAGADPSIAYSHLPHIGTDVLRVVVKNLRKRILALGGEVRFESRVTGILAEESHEILPYPAAGNHSPEVEENIQNFPQRQIKGLIINDTEPMICDTVVLAIGNSARDTLRMLQREGVRLEPKPFSAGVRIEHPQTMVNEAQYGAQANDAEGRLGAAAYKLSHHCNDGRGVYTFCMCPGGVVVGAASEKGGVVTNGMSYFARDGRNANSALLVDVSPEDCGASWPETPLAGLEFQEQLEQKAYTLGGGGYIAPAQRLSDFMDAEDAPAKESHQDAGNAEKNETESEPQAEAMAAFRNRKAEVLPTYRPGIAWKNLQDCLPPFIVKAMREAVPEMAKKLKGFDLKNAVMTGVETRSSSPVRIPRNQQTLQSVSLAGLYPGGEGAGYAGGIMSAAVDGIRIAERILSEK